MSNKFFKILCAAVFLASCASTNKELDEARLLRERSTRFARVGEIASETFNRGEQNFAEGERLSTEKKGKKESKALLIKAIDDYKATIQNGMPAYNAELRSQIDELLSKSDEIKAKVSTETQWNDTTSKYDSAKTKSDSSENEILTKTDFDDALAELEVVLAEAKSIYENVKSKYDESSTQIKTIEEKTARLESLVKQLEKSGGKK